LTGIVCIIEPLKASGSVAIGIVDVSVSSKKEE
jgi:hypothetical protein